MTRPAHCLLRSCAAHHKPLIAGCAEYVKVILAAIVEEEGEIIVEEAELALWQAGCEVLSAVGDVSGAQRCDADILLPPYNFVMHTGNSVILCLVASMVWIPLNHGEVSGRVQWIASCLFMLGCGLPSAPEYSALWPSI
jgi:hypothetical protein